MGEELNRSLRMLAERGEERGPLAVLEDARAQAAAAHMPGRPSWQRGLVVAVGTAASVLVVIAAAILLLRPFGTEELPPATTESPVVPTTIPSTESAGPLNDVNDLALAPNGDLWAATAGGVVRWDVSTGEFEVFTESEGIPGRSVEMVDVAPDGTVWIVGAQGIGRYDGSWQVFSEENTSALDGQIGDLVVGHDGVVWVDVASEAIVRFDGSWADVDPAPDGGWPGVMALAVDDDATLWVGTHFDGVLAFNGSTWEQFDESDGAPPRAERFVIAPDGSLWAWANGYYTDPELSTYVPGTGFARYDGAGWTTYTVEDGLLSNEGSLVVDHSGPVTVIHTELGPDHEPVEIGMSVFDGAGWTTSREIDDRLTSGAVVGPDGTLWMRTESGIVGSDGTELAVPQELATPRIAPFTAGPDREADPIQVSTLIGDFEFTPLRTSGPAVFDTEATPYGWVALSGDVVYRSLYGQTWYAVLTGVEDPWMMADGRDLIVYGSGFTRYEWGGLDWTEVAAVELPGRIQGLAFGSSGAVALAANTVYYSTDGVVFTPAEAGPDLAPVSGRLGCAGWWQEISLAGPGAGPILVTESGYVLLAPSYGTWDPDPLPMCEPRAWSSTDGNRWELLTPESPFGESAVADVATYAGRFVAIGPNDVWVSTDGIEWVRAEVPQLSEATGIAGGDLGWLLVGRAAYSEGTGMWFSADGLTWDGPYAGPGGLGSVYFHIEPTVGSDTIWSVNNTHDGFVIGRLQE